VLVGARGGRVLGTGYAVVPVDRAHRTRDNCGNGSAVCPRLRYGLVKRASLMPIAFSREKRTRIPGDFGKKVGNIFPRKSVDSGQLKWEPAD